MPHPTHRPRRGGVVALLVLGFTLNAASTALADLPTHAYTVTTVEDTISGDCTAARCSLRDAVIAANATPADDTIDVPAGTYKLALAGRAEDSSATGDLDLAGSGPITITGAGARRTIIDGAQLDRVFDVLTGASAEISHLTVTGGFSKDAGESGGGGIQVRGVLALTDATVDHNATSLAGGGVGYGGGIYVGDDGTYQGEVDGPHFGQLSVLRSTISNNTVPSEGGGLYTSLGNLTVTNSTIADNTVDTTTAPDGWGSWGGGGQLYSQNLTMTNVTITGNTLTDRKGGNGGGGAGLANGWGDYRNTIIAGNNALDGITPDECAAAATTYPFSPSESNLDDDGTCFQVGNELHTDPLFGTLGNHGGETDTVSIPADSPAVDAGDDAYGPITDQRGGPRQAASDLGSYEYRESDVSLTQGATPTTLTEGDHIAYTLVASAGKGGATEVTLTDELPDGIRLISASASQGSCSGTATLTCELGSLDGGSSAVVTVLVRADKAGSVTNTATAAPGLEVDTDDTNNSASTTITVKAKPKDPQQPPPVVTPGGGNAPPVLDRPTAAALSVHGGGRRDLRRPYRYTLSGRLTLPTGVSVGEGCRGRVEVQFKAGKQTISTRRVNLSSTCQWRINVTFRLMHRLGRSGKLKVDVRFMGNRSLRARSAKSVYLYFGRPR